MNGVARAGPCGQTSALDQRRRRGASGTGSRGSRSRRARSRAHASMSTMRCGRDLARRRVAEPDERRERARPRSASGRGTRGIELKPGSCTDGQRDPRAERGERQRSSRAPAATGAGPAGSRTRRPGRIQTTAAKPRKYATASRPSASTIGHAGSSEREPAARSGRGARPGADGDRRSSGHACPRRASSMSAPIPAMPAAASAVPRDAVRVGSTSSPVERRGECRLVLGERHEVAARRGSRRTRAGGRRRARRGSTGAGRRSAAARRRASP